MKPIMEHRTSHCIKVPLYLSRALKKKRAIDGVSPDENLIGATLQSLPLVSSNRRFYIYIPSPFKSLYSTVHPHYYFCTTKPFNPRKHFFRYSYRLLKIPVAYIFLTPLCDNSFVGGLVTGVYILQRFVLFFFFFFFLARAGFCWALSWNGLGVF